eukprot:Hpha_TRINITY_DN34091_c0_g1::TRINITY_DN34091_c0_g1_i1::g.30636::m.30636
MAAEGCAERRGSVDSGGLVPIASFARIKPLGAERDPEGTVTKRITGWDAAGGTVEMGGTKFSHLAATLPPDATQEYTYSVIAAPLLRRWMDGYDVDLISYGQTGAGKTFTMFGPPHSMAQAASRLGAEDGVPAEEILREDHGFILRCGFE